MFHVKHFGKRTEAGKVPRETIHSFAQNGRGFNSKYGIDTDSPLYF
jgi:hypothetical protein